MQGGFWCKSLRLLEESLVQFDRDALVQVCGASAQDPGAMVHASDVSRGKNKNGAAAPF